MIVFSSPVGSLCHTPGIVHRPSSAVRCLSSVVCRLCPPQLPEIIKISNPYLVQMFTMFLDCASYVLVVPSTSVIKLWLKNHIFTFLTSSLKQPAGGTSYYARGLLKPRPIYFV